MFVFYIYQRGILATSEVIIWSDAYFEPNWQLVFDLFSSLPLLGLAALVSWRARAPRLLVFFMSMILHSLTDLPFHHDDAHAHFRPISDWRFESPISYWDAEHYGKLFAPIEALFVLGGAGLLVLRSGVRAWRIVGAVTLLCFALFIGFAVMVWR